MAAPANLNEFLDLVRKSGVVDDKRLDAHVEKLKNNGLLPPEPAKAAGVLVRDGFLTHFQAEHIMQGKWRRFTIGKYKVLERIGSGGMGQVYLCEHKLMRRRVAVKVLPTAKAADDSARDRFYREARAVAALDHPNIVHAYDIDQDDNLHFLVMEYVDGANLQEIVKKTGPMEVSRACHYIRQAALGLEHAHEAGLVHRDIKPGNILVDRSGVVKILDMGLARFFNDEDDILTKKYDENVLGTADYLSPEQALDSHAVDIRTDIYSLGATFYYILTGKTPFGEGTVAQKLIWHQSRKPKPLSEFRKDIPPALQQVLNKMMEKDPAQRYAVPGELAEALLAFTQTPIAPPPESEMPHLSPAASGAGPQDAGPSTSTTRPPSSAPLISKPPSATPPPKSAPVPGKPPIRAITPAPPTPPWAAPPNMPTTPAPKSDPERGKPRVVALPGQDEGKIPWDNITSDTANPAALDDTAPQSVRSGRRQAVGDELARRKEKRRLWGAVIILSSLLLITVVVLLCVFVLGRAGPASVSTVRTPLTVARDGSKRFKTIKQALPAAQQGDVIEIHDAIHEENLEVDQRGTEVTVQAAPGKEVRWVSASKNEKTALIYVTRAPGFRIKGKGITLDGRIDVKHKVEDLVLITSISPGLTFEDLQFVNIGKNAIKVMNAHGSRDQPIRFRNLSVPEGEAQKGIIGVYLDANPNFTPEDNDHIEVGAFKGVATAAKKKDSSVVGRFVILPK